MNLNSEFENKITDMITTDENKLFMIKNLVLKNCIKSGFLSNCDEREKSHKYLWFEEVFLRNFYSLNLLETIMVNKHTPRLIEDVDRDVKLKATMIIKDIARRLVSESINNKLLDSQLSTDSSSALSHSNPQSTPKR
ncbi:hypothetical protein AB4440_07775 [Vibrio splendidus]|uniref:hypothetical protein n=1 Tax=Vibrio TaxID=662 RepID=UPI000380912D|nr:MULTISPECIES: hypothetical protein [Vibrio]OEE83699.1 hypothetical protein OAI_05695 [Vibrio cyclitrophicus FF160]PMJ20422.1 hypothetical protein BCU28_02515 [Vibrio cyclitrophicus]PMP00790.1 hypothetical protein BCS97_05285 [Vibrio splendidus]PMP23599.1 hypothetical protein BCS89_02680 [Vibrio splendidus]PMP31002.1 hypothetical protein BCS88_17795 [Vibrio splendidus]